MKNFLQKLIFVFLLIGVTYVYGQKTAYENKVIEIKAKYLRKFGMPAQETEVLRKKGGFFLDLALNQQISKYKERYGSSVAFALKLEMLEEIEQAEKLKTTAEKIRVEKANEEYRRQEAKRRQEEQRKQQEEEAKRRQEEQRKQQEEEAERKKWEEEKALEKAKEMEVYKIKKYIKNGFLRWAEKGEFEKTEDYNDRMSGKKEYLNKLVTTAFTIWIKKFKFRPSVEFLKYDADKEEYEIEVSGRFKNYREGSYAKWNFTDRDIMSVDVETAKELKGRSIYINDIPIEDIIIVDDSYFFIDKFMYNNKKHPISINAPYTRLSDYTLSTEDLGLTEYFKEKYNISQIKLFITDEEGYIIENRNPFFYNYEDSDKRFQTYIMDNIDIKGIKGKGLVEIKVTFDIDEKGKVVDVQTEGSNEELKKVLEGAVKNSKNWNAAVVNGEPVKTKKEFIFKFNFEKKNDKKGQNKGSTTLEVATGIIGGLLNILK